jgi:membrane protease YdiL (CAAX protease family)
MSASEPPPISSTPPPPPPPGSSGERSVVATVFLGPQGVRAGWRLLLFAILFILLQLGTAPLLRPLFHRIAPPGTGLSAWLLLAGDGSAVLLAFLAAFVMGKIEKRTFGAYGLPWRKAFQSQFWEGALWGFVALSALLGALAAAHTFSLGSGGLGTRAAVEQGLLWGAGFTAVGFLEEFLFRGYPLATLTDGIGFWPAAALLSLGFGAIHLGNTGESYLGALMAAGIGFIFCLTVRRTGNLWFAIGLHASWDWAETFFYGVPNSGQVASTHLFSSSSHGSVWLTGGSVGPEGSVLALVVLVVLWVAVDRRFRQVRFPAERTAAR